MQIHIVDCSQQQHCQEIEQSPNIASQNFNNITVPLGRNKLKQRKEFIQDLLDLLAAMEVVNFYRQDTSHSEAIDILFASHFTAKELRITFKRFERTSFVRLLSRLKDGHYIKSELGSSNYPHSN